MEIIIHCIIHALPKSDRKGKKSTTLSQFCNLKGFK